MLSDALRFATVVVIDDMAPNLRLLESSLKAFGLRQVHAFSNSGEGLGSGCSAITGICSCSIWTCRRPMVSRFSSNWPGVTATPRR